MVFLVVARASWKMTLCHLPGLKVEPAHVPPDKRILEQPPPDDRCSQEA